jgi:hypothetical protein
MPLVIINDFESNKRISIYFTPADFVLVDEVWNNEDRLLRDLQHLDPFAGRLRWCDLEPAHYRVMIARNLQRVSEMKEEERTDNDNPIVASLNFLICAFIRCFEMAADCHIDMMRFARLEGLDVSIEITSTQRMETKPKKIKSGIEVVVDNT